MISDDLRKKCLPESTESSEEELIELAMQRQAIENVVLSAFVAVFEKSTDNVLLVQLGNYARGTIGGNPWSLPGGSVEPNEDPRHTVVREVLEEAGVVVESSELQLSAWIARPYGLNGNKCGEITLLFRAHIKRKVCKPNPPETIAARWEPFEFKNWLSTPSIGEGSYSLQPLRRHWIYWTKQSLSNEIGFMQYDSATELRLQPVCFDEIELGLHSRKDPA